MRSASSAGLGWLVVASALALAVAATIAPRAGESRQRPPKFQTSVNYVEVDAFVADAAGRFVRGLTRDDFEILDDNKPQDIAACSIVDLQPPVPGRSPIPTGEPDEPLSDVTTNALGGRVYLLVADLLNLEPDAMFSGSSAVSYRSAFVRMRRALQQFVQDHVVAGDLVGLVSLGMSSRGFAFTASKTRLLGNIARLVGSPSDSAGGETLDLGSGRGDQADAALAEALAGFADAESNKYVSDLSRAYQVLGNAAHDLLGLRGRRKAIVLFSGGTALDLMDRRVTPIVEDLVRSAMRSNVSIDTVDARGLSATSSVSLSTMRPTTSKWPLGGTSIGWDSLRVIAERTGGRAYLGHNDLGEAFRQIASANSSYYLCGYYGPEVRPNGAFHPLTVRVRRPGLSVRARKGYYAPSGRASQAVRAIEESWSKTDPASLLSRPAPTADLGLALRATAVPIASRGSKVTMGVVIEVGPGGLSFENRGGTFARDVEVAHLIADAAGEPRARGVEIAKLRLRPDTHEAVTARGWRFQRQVDLDAGSYQLRLAVRELPGGHAGTVFVDVDVPDVTRTSLHVGGLLLSSRDAGATPTAGALPALAGLMTAPPTLSRVFASTDTMYAFARVWDNAPSPSHSINLRITVRTAAAAREVWASSESHGAVDLGGTGLAHLSTIPLGGLDPGAYVLRIKATDSLGGTAAMREIPFGIQ